MITSEHYRARREALFESMLDNSMAILSAAPMRYRNGDTEYPYRQQSDFYYLTGITESDVIAVLIKKLGQCLYLLFSLGKDETAERWTGPRIGKEEATLLGADAYYPIAQLSEHMPEYLQGVSTVYSLMGKRCIVERNIMQWIETLRHRHRSSQQTPSQFFDLRRILHEQRLIKRVEEIEFMQRACDISVKAHTRAMQWCRAGMYEYELEAVLLHEFYRQGSRSPAYASIVAAGNQACILHYTKNTGLLNDGELVLIDAGAEYEGYAADITRTFPINGKFTAPQQAVYECVLAAQQAALIHLRPGAPWDIAQQQIIKTLVTGLVDLKILTGSIESLIAEKAYLRFYMHNSGHWLGLDVHDVGDYKINDTWRSLVPGMVLTVEPGLYFSREDHTVPEAYRGIGIRIEDDVVITSTGVRVLTEAVPKTVHEIEALMSKR